MAVKNVVTCDWKVPKRRTCGLPARRKVDLPVGRLNFHADLCDEHEEALRLALVRVGLQPTTRVDSKTRSAYVTNSGVPFSGQEARPWLIEQGLAGPTGRLSVEAIEAYAAAH
jgi:hypothetical protein